MTQNVDFVFYTHATAQTGFGHAARCARLAKIITRMMPYCRIGFFGEFEERAKLTLSSIFEPIYLEQPTGRIGIYDRMDSYEDPLFYCEKKLKCLIEQCERVVFMANSPDLPRIPANVTVIGYKIGGKVPNKKNIFWGNEYVPVNVATINCADDAYEQGKMLVALGGAQDMSNTELVIRALNSIDHIQNIDILISPVNVIDRRKILSISHKPIHFMFNVPSISKIILAVDVILASYGHLGYEAMCLGKPVCLVGQKQFQYDYAERLANNGYCISAGLLNTIKPAQLAKTIEETFEQKMSLATNVKKSFDGFGLERTAQVITDCHKQLGVKM